MSGPIKIEIKKGFSSSESKENLNILKSEMEAEVRAGTEWAGQKLNVKVSAEI